MSLILLASLRSRDSKWSKGGAGKIKRIGKIKSRDGNQRIGKMKGSEKAKLLMAASHRNMTVDDVSYPDSLTLFALTWVLRYFAQFLILFPVIMNDIVPGM